MNTEKLIPVSIALGICYAVTRFSTNAAVKAAAYGVAGVVIARQVPYLQDAL